MNEDENIDKDEYNLLHTMRHLPDYGERSLYSKMFEALNLEENEKGIFFDETRLVYFEGDKYVFEESLLSRWSEFPEITGDQKKKAEGIYDELINAKERYPIHEAGHGIAALILGKLCFINLDERRTVVYDSWTDEVNTYTDQQRLEHVDEIRNYQFVCAAGSAAEVLLLERFHYRGSICDRERLNWHERKLREANNESVPEDLDVFDEHV